MGSTKEQFSSLEPSKVPHIYIGDDTQVEVEGKGSVDMDDGTFENFLYVTNLSTNLLSIYQITHYGNGKKVEFTPDSVVVKELDDDALVAVGQVNDNSRLYSFSHFVPSSPSRALLTHSNSESKLWHERFGHLNYRYLQKLGTKDVVTCLPRISFSEGVCSGCSMGKHPEERFDKGKAWRALEVLQLVHSDVAGPFPAPSFSKARYVLTFIDDYSRFTWVYFLIHKSEVFDRFQDFKTRVEKQSGKVVKILRTDNGREYVNKRLEDFCTFEGIDLQHSVAYTPQQNGVAERKNRTLKEMASCMIHARSLDPAFWAEAISCATHI